MSDNDQTVLVYSYGNGTITLTAADTPTQKSNGDLHIPLYDGGQAVFVKGAWSGYKSTPISHPPTTDGRD